MKRHTLRVLAIIIVFALCISALPIVAEARASDYIFARHASAVKDSTGKVTVSFDITAMDRMTEIGATKVEIKNTHNTTVKTFNYTDKGNEHMMGSNRTFYASSVTYQGLSGSAYYAVVYFKAGNSSGSDTRTYTTALTN